MSWKTLAWCAVLGTGLTMGVGCGDDDTPPGGDGGPMAMPLSCGDCTFVATTLAIPELMAGDVVNGFNLDGMTVGPCVPEPVYTGTDGTPGVDNQLAVAAPALATLASTTVAGLNETILETINEGALLVAMEFDGIMTTADTNVSLSIHLVETEGCTGAGEDRVCPAPMLAGDRLAAGQTFNVAATSPNIMVSGVRTVDRRIEAGPISSFPLTLSLGGQTLTLTIRDVQMRATIGADGASLSDGLIGGGIRLLELINAVRMTELGDIIMEMSDEEVIALLGALGIEADLNPDAAGDCDSLSVGIEFTATSASLGS